MATIAISVALMFVKRLRKGLVAMHENIDREKGLLTTALSLSHSLDVYRRCLESLKRRLEMEYAAKGAGAAPQEDGFQEIVQWLRSDSSFLEAMVKEVEALIQHGTKKGVVAAVKGFLRDDRNRIKRLEASLHNRVQSLLLHGVNSASELAPRQAAFSRLSKIDGEGALLWDACTEGTASGSVPFEMLARGYERYICTSLRTPLMGVDKLKAILKATCVSSNGTDSDVVSVDSFELWLSRFGPLRHSLTKCLAVVSFDDSPQRLAWFTPELNAARAFQHVLARRDTSLKAGTAQRVEDTFVLRLASRDPLENHFALTYVLDKGQGDPEEKKKVIRNTQDGYVVVGQPTVYANLVDLIQRFYVDHTFEHVVLSTSHTDAWMEVLERHQRIAKVEDLYDNSEINLSAEERLANSTRLKQGVEPGEEKQSGSMQQMMQQLDSRIAGVNLETIQAAAPSIGSSHAAPPAPTNRSPYSSPLSPHIPPALLFQWLLQQAINALDATATNDGDDWSKERWQLNACLASVQKRATN